MKSLKFIIPLLTLALCAGCQIQPPLKLADTMPLQFALVEMQLRIETVWGIDESWRDEWWYGWDAEDIHEFGELDYPEPTNYEARFYFLGEKPNTNGNFLQFTSDRIWGNTFTRNMPVGWHDILFWSNIDSDDGTQVLLIDESNPSDIHATTTGTRLSYGSPSRGGVYNNPEIFYAGMPETFYISSDPADYDFYDAERNLYIKHIDANLKPLVYTYLVQIVLYHNSNRITGLAERTAVTSLADGVSVHTGHTHTTDAAVSYDMRLKHNRPARNGEAADIFGGKLTTFGLCDMESWVRSRNRAYTGSRAELTNNVVANFAFSNSSDSVYVYNVTDQMQRQSHGGVVTIEIDVDTLKIPQRGSHGGGAGFEPWVMPCDSVEHNYEI